jgi:phosphatidate phosphatase APP1
MVKRYNPDTLKDGPNRLSDGEELFYISNSALGLWSLKSQFSA